jgi:hypothetical protein
VATVSHTKRRKADAPTQISPNSGGVYLQRSFIDTNKLSTQTLVMFIHKFLDQPGDFESTLRNKHIKPMEMFLGESKGNNLLECQNARR